MGPFRVPTLQAFRARSTGQKNAEIDSLGTEAALIGALQRRSGHLLPELSPMLCRSRCVFSIAGAGIDPDERRC
jgi:hypothetical protein